MTKFFPFILLTTLSISIFAQQGDGGKPFSNKLQLSPSGKVLFNEPNISSLKAEDVINDNTSTGPWRFGFNNECALSTLNSGNWITLANGDRIWLLEISCKNALTINLTFSNLSLPEGNELFVYNPEKDFILGKFTEKHIYLGVLGTELVPGSRVIVEYYVPQGNAEGHVNVSRVTHGYRTASEFEEKAFGSSGACNMNVNCPDGLPWQLERNSAVMLVSGSNGFCSGALINNTLNDGKPYVLTANHCYSDPTNWIFRFNWQAAACDNPSSSPTFQSLSGSVLRSRRTPSDFCLVEITGGLQANTVPLSYNPYFSGWNRGNTAPTSTVSIHHPSGDIKKIAFDDAAAIASQGMGSSEANSTWTVEWDRNTTTEGGSSGSPLFDQNHRIIGQLWGGGASCSNLSSPDYYGRVYSSWEPTSSTSANQLKFWLDPNNSGAEFIDGYDPSNATPIQVDAGIANPQGVSGTFCGAEVAPSFSLQNNGEQTLTSATITYSFDSGPGQIYNWTGNLPQWQSVVVSLPTATLTAGNHTFSASVSSPNAGQADENGNNNSVSSTFNVVIGGQTVNLNLTLDCYGSETSWELQDENTTAIYFGTGYPDDEPGLITEPWCLNDGCYTYVIMDSYGDGLLGGIWCGQDGSVSIGFQGDTLAAIPEEDADFGDQTTLGFCIGVSGITSVTSTQAALFPNPISEGVLTVVTGLNTPAEISIVNTTGQRLLSKRCNNTSEQFDVTSLVQGTYFVEINSGAKQKTMKFIKIR